MPAVRGVEISRPFDDVVAEVERLAADGVSEVTLLGQNVNSYGRDLQLAARQGGDTCGRPCDRCSPSCSTAVGAVEGIRRVRFTSPHPKDMRAETFAAMAATRRRCASTSTTRCSRAATACWPPCTAGTPPALPRAPRRRPAAVADLAVSTDIIVGFPGETDDDFAATLEVVAEAQYDYAYTFVFSPRPGTEAAN